MVQTFSIWNRAKNLDDFREGLERFDAGSQNWAYADSAGNLAYFSSAELPLPKMSPWRAGRGSRSRG